MDIIWARPSSRYQRRSAEAPLARMAQSGSTQPLVLCHQPGLFTNKWQDSKIERGRTQDPLRVRLGTGTFHPILLTKGNHYTAQT